MPGDDVYEDTRLAALYDYFNPWDRCDDFYLGRARELGGPVLDVGCGTGLLATRIAEEVAPVTGVEPGAGMVAVARQRPGGDRVDWIHSPGQSFSTDRRFRLAYMTGHAFQAVHTSEAATALLANVGRHLEGDGRFMFETRNPSDRQWERWAGSRRVLDTEEHGPIEESYEVAELADGLIGLTHHIRLLSSGEELTGHSRLRFPSREQVEAECAEAGLDVLEWYGDWDDSPLRDDSVEMIAMAAAAP